MHHINIQQEFKVQLMMFLSRIIHHHEQTPMIVFEQEEPIDRIGALSIGELQEIATFLPDHAITININIPSLAQSIQQQQTISLERKLVQDLLLAGASYPVMNALFGMTSKDVTLLRQQLHIQVNGRPSALSDAQTITINQLWNQLNTELSSAEKLLSLHARTLLPINMLWDAIKAKI
jgi:hypothetical protein